MKIGLAGNGGDAEEKGVGAKEHAMCERQTIVNVVYHTRSCMHVQVVEYRQKIFVFGPRQATRTAMAYVKWLAVES